jgi:Fic family protein
MLSDEVEQASTALRLTEEAVETAAIEGVVIRREEARSSVARRLGLPVRGPAPSRATDGLVEVLNDAVRDALRPLTRDRLFRWHAALFPTGYSGMQRVRAGSWRTTTEPMQVVSGRPGRQHVHFEAPPPGRVEPEMRAFLRWLEGSGDDNVLLTAGKAYFWFETIHPFDDGNGRLGRAIADLVLAREEGAARHLYSLSSQIRRDQEGHADGLEEAQRGDGDLTDWLQWWLRCVERAVRSSGRALDDVLATATFLRDHAEFRWSERQRKVVRRMMDAGRGGFEGGLTTTKYSHLARVSKPTAQRDIADLLAAGILVRRPGGGRSTSYDVAWPRLSPTR